MATRLSMTGVHELCVCQESGIYGVLGLHFDMPMTSAGRGGQELLPHHTDTGTGAQPPLPIAPLPRAFSAAGLAIPPALLPHLRPF